MYLLDSWQQSAEFDPTNPGQRVIESYTGLPGGYSSFYFNQVPNKTAIFNGASLGGTVWDDIKTPVIGFVLVLGAIVWLSRRGG